MKPSIFVADSHRALAELPESVQSHVALALYQAPLGDKHIDAKPLKELRQGSWRQLPIAEAIHSNRLHREAE
jgi:phage-related protein